MVILVEPFDEKLKNFVMTYGSADQGQLGRLTERLCARDGPHRQEKDAYPTEAMVKEWTKALESENAEDVTAEQEAMVEYNKKMVGRRSSLACVQTLLAFKRVQIKTKKAASTINRIFAGGWASGAVDSEGNVYSWGLNNYGQLGHENGKKTLQYKPKFAKKFEGMKVRTVAAGQHHSIILTEEGKVFSVGRGDTGQLGVPFAAGAPQESATPVPVGGELVGETVTQISCGGTCSFAIAEESGKAFAWGFGENHQLGTPDDEDRAEPTLIEGKQLEERTIIHIDAGGQHSCAATIDN